MDRTSIDRAIESLRALLEGSKPILESARDITALKGELPVDQNDPDLLTFVAIESETDDLPIGESRKKWSQEALLDKDKEIAVAEEFYREQACASAKNLISLLEKAI